MKCESWWKFIFNSFGVYKEYSPHCKSASAERISEEMH